jgi:hypothetical protein
MDSLISGNKLDRKKIKMLQQDSVWDEDEFDFMPFIASKLYARTIHIYNGRHKVSFFQKSTEKEIHLRLSNYHFDIIN